MFQFDTQNNWLKNKCTKDIIIVDLKTFKFKKHHNILQPSKCREKIKMQRNTCIWALNNLLKNGLALVLLQQTSKGVNGPVWPSTPLSLSSMETHTHFGGRQLVLTPFLGVNKSWRLYLGCQLLLTPFFWASTCIHAFLGRGCVNLGASV